MYRVRVPAFGSPLRRVSARYNCLHGARNSVYYGGSLAIPSRWTATTQIATVGEGLRGGKGHLGQKTAPCAVLSRQLLHSSGSPWQGPCGGQQFVVWHESKIST